MKPANKEIPSPLAIRPGNMRIDPSRTGEDESTHAHCGGETESVARKSLGFSRPMFVITGVALSMGLVSCFFPYDSSAEGQGGVNRYRTGYRVDSLPGGYRSETISGNTYYYHDGYYYRPGSGGYVIVDPPRNSRYNNDHNRRQQDYPQSYQSSRLDREAPDRHDGRYDRGEIITRLPDGHRVVNHRGETYYQVGDRYYRRQGEIYVMASKPG